MSECLRAWGKCARDGFYPLGLSGQWHGGIHFDEGTGREIHQEDGVRCIADGEVIAFRYAWLPNTSDYRHKNNPTSPDIDKKGRYSTNFVLVRHRLRLPVVPVGVITASNQNDTGMVPNFHSNQDGVPDPRPSLVFYSLYMNLLHLKAYVDAEGEGSPLSCPEFWGGNRRKVGKKCQTPRPRAGSSVVQNGPTWVVPSGVTGDLGHNLVNSNQNSSQGKTTVAWIPQGTELVLQEGSGKLRKVQAILGNEENWAYTGTTRPTASTLWVYDEVLDVLPDIPNVLVPEPNAEPASRLFVPSPPVPIAAGDLIGHMGFYETFEDVLCHINSALQVHVELFARGDELRNFIATCRSDPSAREYQKTAYSLVIARDAVPYRVTPSSHILTLDQDTVLQTNTQTNTGGQTEGVWIKLQPGRHNAEGKFLATGNAVWVRKSDYARMYDEETRRVRPGGVDAWKDFPIQASEQYRMQPNAVDSVVQTNIGSSDTNRLQSVLDESGNRWWYVRTEYRDGNNQQLQPQWGWVREDGMVLRVCSRWEWPGFEIIDDRTQPAEHQIMRQDISYKPSTPMMESLFRTIDLNGDGKLQIQELHDAWKNPHLARVLSRLVVQHDSEWKLDMARWNALDPFFQDRGVSHFDYAAIWQLEKERIRRHAFWDDIHSALPSQNTTEIYVDPNNGPKWNWRLKRPGFPRTHVADHAHPLAVIENFGKLWHPNVRWPLVSNLIPRHNQNPHNNTYGRVRTAQNGTARAHQGWDLYAEEGTACYAIANGRAVRYWMRPNQDTGMGLQLLIELDPEMVNLPRHDTVYAFYAHLKLFSIVDYLDSTISLQKIAVSTTETAGEGVAINPPIRVRKGQKIGETGVTGNAYDMKCFEQHLHFELRSWTGTSLGFPGRINPAELFFAPPLGCPVIDPIE